MNKELIEKVINFRDQRNWGQYHTPANLSKSIVLEAAELLEVFQWDESNYDVEKIKEELADILIYCIYMGESLNLDLEEIILNKLVVNEKKYPVELAKDNAKKIHFLE
jgi:NTP pyrophosphatase (non-canonical NTP hydrolase)